MTGDLIRRGNLESDRHSGRAASEDEGRDLGDAYISQSTTKIVSKPPKARIEAWD